MDKLKVGVVNLGCDKNRIDSEIIIGNIKEKFEVINEPNNADIIIINTCGFIESSKQESIDTILEMAKYKEDHNCKVLIATGCLTQRYGSELLKLIPELDIILGVNDYDKLNDSIEQVLKNNKKVAYTSYSDSNINIGKRVVTTGGTTAYIRISEGCNNKCAYCAIPSIRGKYRSRTIEDILKEASVLAINGYKELILVAQDTTSYGIDIYGEKKLHILLNQLSQIKSIKWIRILYCYAEELTDEIIDEIANNDKVCKYIDIPIQHISDKILKSMRRKGRNKTITDNINKLRTKVPNVVLRTSLIVGFPGEREEDFEELKDFIKEIKFDKLGVFTYSQEEGTAAADMDEQIDDEIKEMRYHELMALQQQISKELNKNRVGKIYTVLIENKEDKMYIGRSYEMAPEIDGEIFIENDNNIKIGQFIDVEIIRALEYDLIGVVLQ
ncbi:ribosomal protein S12 methylthiotransferase RimO [Clostridium argentinense CDC 2741]|uniref:Ribosomal protein uS12 methylthiotransferase RimO n=1 Tax=Clostridium argentinense CDC 2741 TaxID=1418104 RepID=A0A0C1UJ65_9CLOT|nr:30S ribosomal protein S12 methylthiotransferase RimO [Clostridium argentinense]ARC85594.1 ribosomal protein S12 methylthiotransferase RimO [Clostridium argentinense]KIE47320.1 ribosomal protein S12 methylthiotransferase RimO [Clostridium argentinense CDC 2741]NFF40109.1 30S ribosomal protein S12 methylthiotransferase RimO [Clostridium argentinense]NFP52500.1 30S ribosomal protein S12 methylthiotransferase RimO [Clostridium argentinense]NFP73023.1 30S ribosomal protein S12 methylthiotransfer